MRSNHRTEAPDLRESDAPTDGITSHIKKEFSAGDVKKGFCKLDGHEGWEHEPCLDPDAENLQTRPFGFLGRSNGWDR